MPTPAAFDLLPTTNPPDELADPTVHRSLPVRLFFSNTHTQNQRLLHDQTVFVFSAAE